MKIDALRPADTPAYMDAAWLGCISFALGNEELLAQFRKDTGILWRPASAPLDRMIDEATGAAEHFLEAFIPWVNVHVWGPIDGKPTDV